MVKKNSVRENMLGALAANKTMIPKNRLTAVKTVLQYGSTRPIKKIIESSVNPEAATRRFINHVESEIKKTQIRGFF